MILRTVIPILLVATLIGGAKQASAAVVSGGANTTWETAKPLQLDNGPAKVFGVLGKTGDARFYVLEVAAPQTVDVRLDVPVWADRKFHPQLVIYQPDTVSVTPLLPVTPPPNTIALVYPLTLNERSYDRAAMISLTERMATTIDLPVAGKYYVAVYNAGQQSGRWRLTVTGSDDQLPLTTWPRLFWLSQYWASPASASIYLPLVLLATIIAVVWVVRRSKHTQPHHRKKSS